MSLPLFSPRSAIPSPPSSPAVPLCAARSTPKPLSYHSPYFCVFQIHFWSSLLGFSRGSVQLKQRAAIREMRLALYGPPCRISPYYSARMFHRPQHSEKQSFAHSKTGEELQRVKDKNANHKYISTYWKGKFLPAVQHLLDAEENEDARQQLREDLRQKAKNVRSKMACSC